ncbi:hypothetical protein C4K14_5673 [Pseudomonas chlororaphis subsp. aureofaciens]|nr:hypothetical protein C4K14_5673 [Pseudomonas chlororaphis subsp. aureofaciens]
MRGPPDVKTSSQTPIFQNCNIALTFSSGWPSYTCSHARADSASLAASHLREIMS